MRRYLLIAGAVCAGMAASAGDLGQLELNVPYQIQGDLSDYYGVFTPAQSGLVTVTSSPSPSLQPYYDADHQSPIEYSGDFTAHGFVYTLDVTAGVPVYFMEEFCMNDAVFTLSMDAQGLSALDVIPEQGSSISIAGRADVQIEFNFPVTCSSLTFTCEDYTADLTENVVTQGLYALIEYRVPVQTLLETRPELIGQPCSFTFAGLANANDPTMLYNGDGVMRLDYMVAPKPAMLVSDNAGSMTFLSYFLPGNEKGVLKMTFDTDLLAGAPQANIRYGNPEAEDPGEFYMEEIPVAVDGKTLSLDFAGTLRRPDGMVTSGMNYGSMTVGIANVKSADGQYVYSGGYGTLGSFEYILPYEVVNTNVATEFTPAPGSNLAEADKIEIYVTPADAVAFDGVRIWWQSSYEGILIEEPTLEYDAYNGVTVTCDVPEVIKALDGQEVTVLLNRFVAADGLNHSDDITARYTASSGIESVAAADKTVDIYGIDGRFIATATIAEAMKTLPAGFYVADGKKICVKR